MKRASAAFAAVIVASWLTACSSSPTGLDAGRGDGATPDRVEHDDVHPGDVTSDVLDASVDAVDVSDAPTDRGDVLDGGHCGFPPVEERASIAVHAATGDLSCASGLGDGGGAASPTTWTGVVTSSDATSIVLDMCQGMTDGGAADAGPSDATVGCMVRVEARAPGLDLTSFPRVRVRVRAAVTFFFACQQSLEITTAGEASVDGQSASETILLAVVDGGGGFADAPPYTVARVPLGCTHGPVCGGSSRFSDIFAFEFSGPGAPTRRVYMGESVQWTLGASTYAVRNLRSFQSPICDDYWNWAYTIYIAPK